MSNKLPTAEETLSQTYKSAGWRYDLSVLPTGCPHESLALDAIESHTAAHTAALREELDASKEDLWSERIINEALRNSLQDRDDFIKLHIDLGVKLNEENKSLTKKIDSLKKMADAAIKKMVDAEQKYHNLDLKRTSELKGLNERVKELEERLSEERSHTLGFSDALGGANFRLDAMKAENTRYREALERIIHDADVITANDMIAVAEDSLNKEALK